MELYEGMVREKWGEGFIAGPWGWSEDQLVEYIRHGAVVCSERTMAENSTAQHSTAQHSTAHTTTQHSNSTAQRRTAHSTGTGPGPKGRKGIAIKTEYDREHARHTHKKRRFECLH